MSARDVVLARVRRALADVPVTEEPGAVEVPRAYAEHETAGTLERFVERVSDYGAGVTQVASAEVASAIADVCRAAGIDRVVLPSDLPGEWLPPDLETAEDSGPGVELLDEVSAAVTGCAFAIAETGTLVFDAGARQGRRALTLVPDFHLCVVEETQVVDGVPAAMRRLAPVLRGERRPVTFVSGPSATSDIELSRVEGVHGPRRLELVVVRG
ncbi:MAG: LutC/YkgG family protein [Gaiellaceae bacterium]